VERYKYKNKDIDFVLIIRFKPFHFIYFARSPESKTDFVCGLCFSFGLRLDLGLVMGLGSGGIWVFPFALGTIKVPQSE